MCPIQVPPTNRGKEAATVTYTAVVLNQARQPAIDAVVETVNLVGRMVFHFAQVNELSLIHI